MYNISWQLLGIIRNLAAMLGIVRNYAYLLQQMSMQLFPVGLHDCHSQDTREKRVGSLYLLQSILIITIN
jgi:hypothetical protein